jgi:hypothetical protein
MLCGLLLWKDGGLEVSVVYEGGEERGEEEEEGDLVVAILPYNLRQRENVKKDRGRKYTCKGRRSSCYEQTGANCTGLVPMRLSIRRNPMAYLHVQSLS